VFPISKARQTRSTHAGKALFKVVGADQDRRKMDIPETAFLHITVEFAAFTPVLIETPSVAGDSQQPPRSANPSRYTSVLYIATFYFYRLWPGHLGLSEQNLRLPLHLVVLCSIPHHLNAN
jgi:hypothetical protein